MWKSIGNGVKELFFPARCFLCKKYGDLLCDDCKSLMDISPAHRPDHGSKYLADIYSACPYENKFVQKLIHGFKYEPLYYELAIPLAGLITDHFALAAQNFNMENFAIIPVPLASKRLRWRGFNQAEAIANRLGHLWQIPASSNYLARRRETENQAELTKYERRNNTKGAFVCLDNAPFEGRPVFLVDDVVTTGATMNECAKILLKNGARQVIGVSIARTENI